VLGDICYGNVTEWMTILQ